MRGVQSLCVVQHLLHRVGRVNVQSFDMAEQVYRHAQTYCAMYNTNSSK